jgi:hypothetical protein
MNFWHGGAHHEHPHSLALASPPKTSALAADIAHHVCEKYKHVQLANTQIAKQAVH